jgi:hypothetical protein
MATNPVRRTASRLWSTLTATYWRRVGLLALVILVLLVLALLALWPHLHDRVGSAPILTVFAR